MMANPATPTDLLHRPYLTGDPGNYRSDLASKGITFDLQYVNDYFGVVKGDTIRGHDDDWGRVRFTLDVDFGKLAGINGLSFHITGLNQNGGNAGNNIGSVANPSSLVSAQTSRLDSYWLQQKLFNGVLVLKIGQMAQQDFYGVQEYGGSYVMEPLGYAYGTLFGAVHATFDPASKPGAEIQLHPYGGFYLKSMYQKGQSNPYGDQDHHGFGFDTGGPRRAGLGNRLPAGRPVPMARVPARHHLQGWQGRQVSDKQLELSSRAALVLGRHAAGSLQGGLVLELRVTSPTSATATGFMTTI